MRQVKPSKYELAISSCKFVVTCNYLKVVFEFGVSIPQIPIKIVTNLFFRKTDRVRERSKFCILKVSV